MNNSLLQTYGGLTMRDWRKWLEALCEVCLLNDSKKQQKKPDDIILIQQAQEELLTARQMFALMEDPDMVDWAVYNINAAEKRYDYLLKNYRHKIQPELSRKNE
jgi:protein subunit release factor A